MIEIFGKLLNRRLEKPESKKEELARLEREEYRRMRLDALRAVRGGEYRNEAAVIGNNEDERLELLRKLAEEREALYGGNTDDIARDFLNKIGK